MNVSLCVEVDVWRFRQFWVLQSWSIEVVVVVIMGLGLWMRWRILLSMVMIMPVGFSDP